MQTITIDDAQKQLPALIAQLGPGEQLVITSNNQPAARLTAEPQRASTPHQPGSAVGQLIILKEDDEHLKDFQEYMECDCCLPHIDQDLR